MEQIRLTKEECYCGIQKLYDKIAVKLGYDPEDATYNCAKIYVTKPVQEQIFAYYKEQYAVDDADIGVTWIMCGPKTNLPGNDYVAEADGDFIAVSIPF